MREINVDKAWNTLYTQLGKDDLLPETETRIKANYTGRWAAAIILLCLSSVAIYFAMQSGGKGGLLSLQNTDKEQILVTTLSDGSTVYLDDDASLSFPKSFAEDKRIVKMKGKVLFDVSKDRKRPFIIETQSVFIEVLGTSFDVCSPKDDSGFSLSVRSGEVKVTQKSGGETVHVRPGETVLLESNRLQKKLTSDQYRFDHYVEKMSFKDEKLEDILKVIENTTGHSFVLQGNGLAERKLTVAFENNSVNSMTGLICLALNLKYTEKEGITYISLP